MSARADAYLRALSQEDRVCCEQIACRFEDAWQRSPENPPDLLLFLPAAQPLRGAALVELARIDLGRRLKRGETVRVEQYLERFPELAGAPDLAWVVLAEGVQHCPEPGKALEEYGRRFPHCRELLQAWWQARTRPETPTDGPEGAGAAGTAPGDVPGYEVLGELGRGGMGVVYQARQRSADRVVALKVVRADRLEVGGDEERRRWLDRFHREARAAARLVHDNILPVYEVGQAGGRPFYSMRYLEGRSLAEALRERPLPDRDAAACLERVARAVHYAHEQGILHRDLKPANILLDTENRPFVTDFGLVKWVEGPQDMTQTGQLLGSPPYMSPEQAQDAAGVTAASDIYSLGATLYHALTGRPPFQAAQVPDTLRQVQDDDPVPPRRLNRAVSRDLETICLKCLEKDPKKRYPTAEQLADDLRRFLAHEPIKARRVGLFGRGWRWGRRNPLAATLTAAVFVLLTAFTLGAAAAAVVYYAMAEHERLTRKDAEEARDKQEIDFYFNRIALVQRELDGDNFSRAEALLDECPGRLRGWEWHYLRRQLDKDPRRPQGHAGGVWRVAFSPDSRQVASASIDGRAKIWDARTGQELHALSLGLVSLPWPVMGVAWSPDGSLFAAGGWVWGGSAVRVWDAQTWRERKPALKGCTAPVISLVFSPDSKRLAAAGGDNVIRIWDVATGEPVAELRGHNDWISRVAFSADGAKLVSSSMDKTIKVWDATTGRELRTLEGHTAPVADVVLSPDGGQLASASLDGTIRLWDPDTGKGLGILKGHTGSVLAVTYTPDGRRLASGSFDKTVKLWDPATGEEVLTLRGHTDMVWGVAFSPDGHRLVSGGWDKMVRVWDATPDTVPAAPSGQGESVNKVIFHPEDGDRMASAGWEGTVKLWRITPEGPTNTALRGHTGAVWGLAFDRRGERLATGGWDGTVRVWDVRAGAELLTFRDHATLVNALAFSPDGRRLASASWDGKVNIWDPVTGRKGSLGDPEKRWHPFPILGLAFAPDGRMLATASGDRTVGLWDAATGDNITVLSGHQAAVHAVAFNTDGTQLASAGWDKVVLVWDLRPGPGSGKACRRLEGHTDRVNGVAFSPDGKRLATASSDKTVRLWDAATGEEVHAPFWHRDVVWDVAFSPDGKRLATATWYARGGVRVWDLAN
jgi:WD40 repeat protein/predicted Ser/Thr protein kinase